MGAGNTEQTGKGTEMTTSTDAILMYGVALHDFDECGFVELPFSVGTDEDDDFENFVARRAGVPMYGEEGYEYKKIMAANEAYPVDLVRHCSFDAPMWVLGIKDTKKRASRGYPVALNGTLPVIPNEGVRELKKLCDEFKIEFVPDWYLFSDWG